MKIINTINNEYSELLSKKECYDLLKKYQSGDEYAFNKIVYSNIKLVLYEINKKFKNIKYTPNKDDLISVGIIGLIKSIKTFDISKNVEFSTYTIKCIDNEIFGFLRNLKKNDNIDSIDRIIDENNDELIIDNSDILWDITDKETYNLVKEIVEDLEEREKIIIKLYFGFENNNTHSQEKIAKILGLSQSYVSRIIKDVLIDIKIKLEKQEILGIKNKNQRNILKK